MAREDGGRGSEEELHVARALTGLSNKSLESDIGVKAERSERPASETQQP